MADAMVTARISLAKKTAGNQILEDLGSNTSQAINELYDYIIAHKTLPWRDGSNAEAEISSEQLREALDWVEGLGASVSSEFARMPIKDARRARLGLE